MTDLIKRDDALAAIDMALNNATGDLFDCHAAIRAVASATLTPNPVDDSKTANPVVNDPAAIPALQARIKKLVEERDHWSGVAGREGVCMTCSGPNGAPEPYGCTDCLNTGYCGEHHNTVADLEAKLAKVVEALETIVDNGGAGSYHLARATLAELEGK